MSLVHLNEETSSSKLFGDSFSYYESSMKAKIKGLSKLAFRNFLIFEYDKSLTGGNSKAQNFFDKCTNEIDELASIKFYDSCICQF